MELSEEDVFQILKIIEKSSFDFFQIEMEDLKIVVNKGVDSEFTQIKNLKPVPDIAPENAERSMGSTETRERQTVPKNEQIKTKTTVTLSDEGLVRITAPLLGTFYNAPKPGEAPFVQQDSVVKEDTVVGLIEVMKVFSSVKAGVCGRIVEILVENGQFIEYGHELFLVKPDPLERSKTSK